MGSRCLHSRLATALKGIRGPAFRPDRVTCLFRRDCGVARNDRGRVFSFTTPVISAGGRRDEKVSNFAGFSCITPTVVLKLRHGARLPNQSLSAQRCPPHWKVRLMRMNQVDNAEPAAALLRSLSHGSQDSQNTTGACDRE